MSLIFDVGNITVHARGNLTNRSYYGPEFENPNGASFIIIKLLEIIPPIFIVCGLIGNIYIIFTLLRLRRQLFWTCSYLGCLAVVDIAIILLNISYNWIYNVWRDAIPKPLVELSPVACVLYHFLTFLFGQLSSWLVVVLALELTIIHRRPDDVDRILSFDRVKDTMLVVLLMLTFVNIHVFWTYRIVTNIYQPDQEYCSHEFIGTLSNEAFRDIVIPCLAILFHSLLPFIALLGFSIYLVITRCRRGDYIFSRLQEKTVKTNTKEMETFTRMSICLIVITALLILPEGLFLISIQTTNNLRSIGWLGIEIWEEVGNMMKNTLVCFKVIIYLAKWPLFRKNAFTCRCHPLKTNKKIGRI